MLGSLFYALEVEQITIIHAVFFSASNAYFHLQKLVYGRCTLKVLRSRTYVPSCGGLITNSSAQGGS